MQMDWLLGALGGALIGAAATAMLLVNGRIMGASGILGGLLERRRPVDWIERLLFLAGMLAAPLIYRAAGGQIEISAPGALGLAAAAGLLVGIGTRMGGGCTSGHGVCGMPRLSRRSWVAVPVFMATAIATVALMRLV
ncbi:MAG: YeeE/YedE thiosulfate transporter family protein [Pseudomonadota bacterium]